MAQNSQPITCPVTPNRGVNSYTPSWLTTCTDSATNTTNPSLNSILDTIDLYAQSKTFITISHSCNSDFTAVAGSEHLAFQEAIAYATSGSEQRTIVVIPDSPYTLNQQIDVLNSFVNIWGQYSTIIYSGGVVFNLYQVSDVSITGFIIRDAGYPVSAQSCSNISLRDLKLINTSQVLFSLHSCSEISISNTISTACEKIVVADLNSYNINIESSTFKSCINGVSTTDSKFINVRDCHIELSGADANARLYVASNGYGNSFLGNTVYDPRVATTFSPIYINNHNGFRVSNNYLSTIVAGTVQAVEKINSYSCVINSNNFLGYNTTTSSVNGLDPSDSAIGNVF